MGMDKVAYMTSGSEGDSTLPSRETGTDVHLSQSAEPLAGTSAQEACELQSPFVIGAATTEVRESLAAEAQSQFTRFRAVACADVVQPSLLANLQRTCNSGGFISDQAEPGHREVESPQRASRALNLALNRAPLLRWLEQVSGCGPLRAIEGRVVQTFPRAGDELAWHDDLVEPERRLAITINLGDFPVKGGLFELRRKGGGVLFQHLYRKSGAAVIFAVRPNLEHRVLPLTSGGPRRVYAGWAFSGSTL